MAFFQSWAFFTLFISSLVGAHKWFPTPTNIIHLFLSIKEYPKYFFFLSSNNEMTRVVGQKKLT